MSRRRLRENGQSSEKKLEQRLQATNQQSMAGESDPFTAGREDPEEYLETLTEHDLQPATAELVSDLLSSDLVLGNISDAEKEEARWLIRDEVENIKAMHPPERSPVQGRRRAALYDDETETLESLSDTEKKRLEQAIWNVFFRLGRSKGGWQQEELSSQYKVSKVDNDSGSEEESRLGGLF